MKNKLFTVLIPFAMVSALAVAEGERATPPDPEPGAILDHVWQVGHSKKGLTKVDCVARTCIRKGDYIMLVRTPPDDPGNDKALLIIHSASDGNVFGFDAEYKVTHSSGSNRKIIRVEATFIDHVSCPHAPPTKKLTIKPVRINESDYSNHECTEALKLMSDEKLEQNERDAACTVKNLIHWKVKHVSGPSECPRAEEDPIMGILTPPEDGQGTGSGGGQVP